VTEKGKHRYLHQTSTSQQTDPSTMPSVPKRQCILHRPYELPRSQFLFLGRVAAPPLCFGRENADGPWRARHSNAQWLATGTVSEPVYLSEVLPLAVDDASQPPGIVGSPAGSSDNSDGGVVHEIDPWERLHPRPPARRPAPTPAGDAPPRLESQQFKPPVFAAEGKGGLWNAQQNRALWAAQVSLCVDVR
jgi:hypothetical protein